MDEDENVKTFNQSYLFEALSFTEAETRAYAEMESYIRTEFKVSNIRLENFGDILPDESNANNPWYKCKLSTLIVDEDKGAEKRSNSYVLVQASDVPEAHVRLSESMKDALYDFEIPAIALSPVLDVFPYFENDEATEKRTDNES